MPHMHYESLLRDTAPLSASWRFAGPRLEYLYTEFLLHKLLFSQNEGDRDRMIQTSHEVIQITLPLMRRNGVQDTGRFELEWTVSYELVSGPLKSLEN
jgi:hypothetical protein